MLLCFFLADVEDTRHRTAFLDGGAVLNIPLFCLRGICKIDVKWILKQSDSCFCVFVFFFFSFLKAELVLNLNIIFLFCTKVTLVSSIQYQVGIQSICQHETKHANINIESC